MANFEARSTPRDRSLLYLQDGDHHRSARLFNGGVGPLEVIKPRRCDEHLWRLSEKIPDRVRKYIKNAGFDGVLRTGYHKFDHALITALVERWRPETHTFHFPVGEATVTLQDVQVLWALPIDGPVVSGIYETKTPEEWSVEVFEYMGFYADEDEVKGGRINLSRLIAKIRSDCEKGKDNYKKRARVYILALLGGHLFSDANSVDVSLNFLKNIDKLSVRRRQSWGSAVLAYLYRQLCNAATAKDVKGIQGPLILLQIWAWERMPQIAPRILLAVGPNHYPHCYASTWNRPLNHTWTPSHVLVTYRAAFTGLREGDFEWCPYDGPEIMASLPTDCKSHRELWHYCGWMVFWNVTEPHVPNRVSRQFGYVQGVPEPLYIFPVRQHLDDHKDKLSGGRGTNWLEKKAVKIDCWKIRNSNIYQFSGPAGVGVTPAYMPWFYDRTVLVITSPGAQNPPNAYPEWGGVQQTQNETLRHIHDRAQGLIDAGVGNSQMLQDFVQLPRQTMEYGHNLDRMNYGSQQFYYPEPGYYPRPPSPPRDGGGYTAYQPQFGRQFEAGGSSFRYGQQFEAGGSSFQYEQQFEAGGQQFQSGGGSFQYGQQSQFQGDVGGTSAHNQATQEMIDELQDGLTPTWLSLSPNLQSEQSNWAQPNFQRSPNTDMVARRSAYADNSPVQIQSFGDFGLSQNIDINQPPNEENDVADGQDRRTRPVRGAHPRFCFSGSHNLQQQHHGRR